MSYIPHRDNKDIDGKVSVKTLDALDKLVDKIDKSSIPGQHRDACGCSDPQCRTLQNIRLCSGATLPEALAWLYVKGMLTLPGTTAEPTPEAKRELASMINRGRMQSLGHCYDDLPQPVDFETATRIIEGGWRPRPGTGPDAEATRDEVGQIVDEFGCTPSAWATEQAVEKLFEFYRIYPREPVDLGPDLVAEAGLSPVDEDTRTKVLAEFDAADPNAMTHRSRTHDVRATQWNKHGDHPSVFTNDCQPTPHDENLMCCDKPSTDHGWIRATDEDVCPGNWIVTDTDGTIDVFNAETFVSVYEPIKKTIAADGAR